MQKLTTKDFIDKSNNIHSFKYDYSNTIYKTIKDDIVIICPRHGKFIQKAEKHLKGRGCKKCGTIKQKETCLRHYGTEYPTQNKNIQKKIKKSLINKYGAVGLQSDIIKEKVEATNTQKYGCKNVFQSDKIREKGKQTKLNRYGDENYVNVDKARATCLKKYGVDNPFKLKTNRNNTLNSIKHKIIKAMFDGNRLKNKVTPLFSKDEYKNVKTEYNWKCTRCNTAFIDNLDDGKTPRCPTCFPYKFSALELEIINYIKSILPNEEIRLNDRKLLNGNEVDVYLPDKKIAIEIDGLYFHAELSGNKNRNYHLNKTILCEKMGIRLIHIFEDEIKNNIDIVKSRLNSILKTTVSKIYARNCTIRAINKNICHDFLIKNHLQGFDNSSIKLGAFYKDELIAVMTFGKLRVALGQKQVNNEYELYRFCTKLNTNIIGIASKMLKFFITNYSPSKIISYCDRRYSDGNLYEKINFKKVSETPPNYWYTKNNGNRYHRFNFRKDILNKKLKNFDANLSEWENMKNNGWDRIWDCGNLKYIWENQAI